MNSSTEEHITLIDQEKNKFIKFKIIIVLTFLLIVNTIILIIFFYYCKFLK